MTKSKFLSFLKLLGLFFSGILLGMLLLAYFSGAMLYDYKDSIDVNHFETPPLPVDVIVCLAGGRGRIAYASKLWKEYYDQSKNPPVLYISGMGNSADWNVFSSQVDPEILKILPKDKVVLETISSNTQENAKIFVQFAKQNKWKSVALVTASYHLKRSLILFRQELNDNGYDEVKLYPASVIQEPFNKQDWNKDLYGIQVTLFEFLKWVFTRGVIVD